MSDTAYLKQRRLTWYAQLAVPVPLQGLVGAKVLTRSLATRDLTEARKRRHAVIAELQSVIAQAVARATPSAPSADSLLDTAVALRAAEEAGETSARDSEAAFNAAADAYLDAEGQRRGRDAEGHPVLSPAELATVRRAHAAIAGRLSRTLASLAESYLTESADHQRVQSVDEKRRHLFAFLDWFGADREAPEVTRKVAGAYVAEVIQKRTKRAPGAPEGAPGIALSAVTRRKEVSALRTFFDWLTARGITDANPFDRMSSTIRASKRGGKPKRRPWLPAELSKVLHGVPVNDPLWSLTVIAAYTGMRREEVAELKVSSLDGKMFVIEEGKTLAAVRRVPVHTILAPLVRQLAKTSGDGFLIPGLLRGGPDNKRSWYLGKRFGHVIRQQGITDDALDFHALRGTVITQLEGAGVPESTIQLIVGHKRQGMTLGVYSGGVPDSVKRAALAHVSYGKALDAFVSDKGAGVVVSASAKPRKRKAELVS